MIPLSTREVGRLSDAIHALYSPVQESQYADRAIEILGQLFPEAFISFDTVSNRTGAHKHISNFTVANQQEWLEHLAVRMHFEHPGVAYARTHGPRQVFRLLDLITEREFHNTGLYCEHFRPLGAVDQLAAIIPDPDHVIGFAVNRDTRFGDKDARLLDFLRPHLLQAFRNARLFSALQSTAPEESPFRPTDAHRAGLTPKEAEVLRWIAEGKRDGEIAIILGATPRTIEKHVQRILAKLRVPNRAGAAAWANRPE